MNKKIFRKRNIGRYFLWSLHLVSVALWFCSVSFLESRLRGVTHLLFPQSNHTTFKCVLLPFVKLYEPLVYFCTWSKLLIVSLSVCCHFFHVFKSSLASPCPATMTWRDLRAWVILGVMLFGAIAPGRVSLQTTGKSVLLKTSS